MNFSLCTVLKVFLEILLLSFANGEGKEWADTKIVGGEEALKNEFPWMVNLRTSTGGLCGGSIIDEDWILTAAHCVTKEVEFVDVVAGDHFLFQSESSEQRRRSSVLVSHEAYSSNRVQNDIALIKLREPLTFTTSVQPIDLPNSTFIATGTVTVAGWGTLNFQGEVSSVLMKVNVNVIPLRECQDQYGSTITENMICASSPGKDSCQGDSGGPLMCRSGTDIFVCGIVSFGNGCATPGYSGVYTKVVPYLDWINKTMNTTWDDDGDTTGKSSHVLCSSIILYLTLSFSGSIIINSF